MKYPKTGNFRFRKLGKSYLVTNQSGSWVFLSLENFRLLLEGQSSKIKSKKISAELREKGFIYLDKGKIAKMAGEYLRLNNSFLKGPSLFIVVLTLRCNHRCVYCHASSAGPREEGYDMNRQTAKKIVDLIFDFPAESPNIEFQGGEPLLNWPILEFIVRYAKRMAQEKKKNVRFSLVSNLALLDKKKMEFLFAEDVNICCSFDGPAKVHDKNRKYLSGSSYGIIKKKSAEIKKFFAQKKTKKVLGREFDAVLTVSRASLPFYKEIVDEYVNIGASHIFIRPLSPMGFGAKNTENIGYEAEEYIVFWKKAMNYILELNKKGKIFVERGSYCMLKKILQGEDPAYLDLRSPCGAGIGQLAFDYDGKVYTCDEGRMAARMGFNNFLLGEADDSFKSLLDNGVVKTMCLASCLDNHAACFACAYKPYCGTCPIINFVEQGTIFPQISNTDRCKINKAMFDYFFAEIKNKKHKAIFEEWLKQ